MVNTDRKPPQKPVKLVPHVSRTALRMLWGIQHHYWVASNTTHDIKARRLQLQQLRILRYKIYHYENGTLGENLTD